MGSPLRRLIGRRVQEDGGLSREDTDLRIHPGRVVSLTGAGPSAVGTTWQPRTCITLVTGEEWVVIGTPDTVESLLWPEPVDVPYPGWEPHPDEVTP